MISATSFGIRRSISWPRSTHASGSIIDAAFRMTQQIIDASNSLAVNLVGVTGNALEDAAKPTK